jgi:bla regulator protein blaR1
MDFLYQIFSEDLIYALGWTVLHSLWQALAIGLLMAVGMLFLQDKAAKVRYELAAMSLFMVFMAALSTFLIYYEKAKEVADFTTIHLQEDMVALVAAETGMMTVSTLESYLQYFNQHIPLIVTAWFLGVCFFLLRLMGGLVYIQRLKFTHNKPASDFWTKRVQQISRQLKLRRTVKLVESSLATVPMVIGYFKPVILMPIGTINGLSHSEVNAILAHELAHVYRNDFIINIFLSIIEVLFYFNPAVWWIAANIRTERENCCDDVAIALCGNSLIYAKALLRLQELSQSVPGYA